MLDDTGEIDRWPAISPGDCTDEPKDFIDGAAGGEVDAGTEARYSAPGLGMSRLPILVLLLLNALLDERSLRLSSSVFVLGREGLYASLSLANDGAR